MLRRLFEGIKQGAGRVVGLIKEPLRRIGSTMVKYHQPISMITSGILASSSNPTLQKLGAGVALGSAYLTSKGVGNNYLGMAQGASPNLT
jgi:hypothetical protein